MDRILTIVNTVRTNRGKSPLAEIKPGDRLREDLGFDSLDLAELTVRVEAEFDVDIFSNGIITTVAQVLDQLPR